MQLNPSRSATVRTAVAMSLLPPAALARLASRAVVHACVGHRMVGGVRWAC
jgi:hypothetical protein